MAPPLVSYSTLCCNARAPPAFLALSRHPVATLASYRHCWCLVAAQALFSLGLTMPPHAHPTCCPVKTSFSIKQNPQKRTHLSLVDQSSRSSHSCTGVTQSVILTAQVSHNHPFHHILTRRKRKNRNCPIHTHHTHTLPCDKYNGGYMQ